VQQTDADLPLPAPRPHRGITAWLCWYYAILVLAAWLYLRIDGDRSWLGIIAIFAPRWIILLPLIFLFPLTLVFRRRSLWILGLTTAFAVFEVMGFCLPWRVVLDPKSSSPTVRVLTCNVHVRAADFDQLTDLIAETHPDIVVLQEWPLPVQFPPVFLNGGEWHISIIDEQFLATRFDIIAAGDLRNHSITQYVLGTPSGPIRLFNVHLASPHPPLFDALIGKPNGKAELEKNVQQRMVESAELSQLTRDISDPLLIAGDFNLCPDSPIFRANFGGFTDAFAHAGIGFGWTYSAHSTSTRIDHILCNSKWTCRDCWGGPDVGSPHRPVIADFCLRKTD
jgi:vancomycin resistance protein VanJ